MRITIDIDEKLLQTVVFLTGEGNKGKAVNAALAAFVKSRRLEELRAIAGSVEVVDNLRALEELEMKEMGKL